MSAAARSAFGEIYEVIQSKISILLVGIYGILIDRRVYYWWWETPAVVRIHRGVAVIIKFVAWRWPTGTNFLSFDYSNQLFHRRRTLQLNPWTSYAFGHVYRLSLCTSALDDIKKLSCPTLKGCGEVATNMQHVAERRTWHLCNPTVDRKPFHISRLPPFLSVFYASSPFCPLSFSFSSSSLS